MIISDELGYWELFFCITNNPVPELPSSFSPEFISFISECMKKDPSERTSVSGLLQHPFVTRYQSFDICKSLHDLMTESKKIILEDLLVETDEAIVPDLPIPAFPNEVDTRVSGIQETQMDFGHIISTESIKDDLHSIENNRKDGNEIFDGEELNTSSRSDQPNTLHFSDMSIFTENIKMKSIHCGPVLDPKEDTVMNQDHCSMMSLTIPVDRRDETCLDLMFNDTHGSYINKEKKDQSSHLTYKSHGNLKNPAFLGSKWSSKQKLLNRMVAVKPK